MPFAPRARKILLTAHVTSSVGWFGAVLGFLPLAIAGRTSADAQIVRASYLAMQLLAWSAIVPLAVASLLTGVIQSLGTNWGLFRYRWVVAKLVLTVVATLALLIHTKPIGWAARAAAQTTLSAGDLVKLRTQLIADAGAALLLLLIVTVLAIFKPGGMTGYGRRRNGGQPKALIEQPGRP